jgi:hypothetical protein
MRNVVAVLFGVLLAAAPAAAQDYKPVDVNFGFGWVFPVGDIGSTFDAGWHGTVGVTYNLNPKVGILADYTYFRMGGPDKVILISEFPGAAAVTNGLIESNHQMHVGTFNMIYKVHPDDSLIGWYGLGGLGVYHRTVQLTSPSVGYTTICDPYWYVCYPGIVEVDKILGDRSSTDFGINFGGGITIGREGKFYIESRYHYVWGPTVQQQNIGDSTLCAGGCSTNAGYFPLTFGFKW